MPARTGREATPPGSAPAVVRAIAVLDALAADDAASMSLSDIARAIGVPKSSTASICAALELGGLLVRDNGEFALGRRLVELGGAYLSRSDRVREFYAACVAEPLLVGETVRLWALGGRDGICLGRYDGHPPVRLTVNIGDRLPASVTAAGKVMLAQFDDHEVRDLYAGTTLPRLTAASLSSIDALVADLHTAREDGYCVSVEEAFESVVELAVVVPSRGTRTATMAIGVTQHTVTYTPEHAAPLVSALRRVAAALGNPMQVAT
ncbi:DNA-binding IclR family transcriptional regulator [Kineosphaera limosa]|uniref:Putative IclR family transcriptional regulator n=1 Tax=Kineosphaera limosa NBRC 100340 TaxID=1184609 RepID=K6WSM5_9MICO|nr:IclR family transcriptional regulator C-terminal domain-containing protein [Kineosphaera limosa]NYE02995.1 DNA-binding IclR family transcriptional regulator [Kineosphaera limosa]GAB95112.1 putative IclR family transcriptional regulator [Kineosphaera limosa NBRC 100340]